jgi:Fe-S cluster biogenesis protein NfuA
VQPSLKDRVIRAMAEQVAPALEMDPTQIEVAGVEDRIIQIRLHGGCGSCPSSIMTIVMGIEQELRRHVPEVEFVEVTS